MSMGFTTHKHLDLWADDEDPSQLIIWPEWDAPHVRCLPRVICAWPCLLRQVGTTLGSPCDCIMTGITYANPGSRQLLLRLDKFRGTAPTRGRSHPQNLLFYHCQSFLISHEQSVKEGSFVVL